MTLALGFTVGCVPVVGAPTLLCTALALGLRLNLPAIQAANYAAMPFQLALIVPFLRLGGKLFAAPVGAGVTASQVLHFSPALLRISPVQLAAQMGEMAGQAMLGWFLVALPAAGLMTVALTLMLRRIPALAKVEAAD